MLSIIVTTLAGITLFVAGLFGGASLPEHKNVPIKEPMRSQFIIDCMTSQKAPVTFCLCVDRNIDTANLELFQKNKESIIKGCIKEANENM